MENDLISKLSEMRSQYNLFDKNEEPQYRALSEAIKILSQRADGDTISRQAAVDALLDEPPEMNYGFYYAEKIKALPSAQRWIPCSERLPEERSDWKNVTVIDEIGDTSYIYTSVGFYLKEGCWIVDNEPMDDNSSIRVLAWASMPESYKPPKEEI